MSRRISNEERQSELVVLINDSLQVLKSQKWSELIDSDKNLILGLFGVIGDWQGFSRIIAGSSVNVEVSKGQWSAATVVDDGVGKRKVSVILDEDANLQVMKVAHEKVRVLQTAIDQKVAGQLNFDDLCQAMTFLHRQLRDPSEASKPETGSSLLD